MELAVVYPVYNEADILEEAANKTVNFLEDSDIRDFKVVFVSDGSTDGTQKKADKLEEKILEVKHVKHGERLGKGAAFEKAYRETEAEKIAYCDADLSTDLKHLEEAVKHLENGYSIVSGSRRVEKGLERGLRRELPSIFFNELMKKSFRSKIEDHQCGFKLFRTGDVEELFGKVDSSHWFWDAEMLVRAQRKGLEIKEFPVDWKDTKDSKVNVVKDSFYFLKKTCELRIKLWR